MPNLISELTERIEEYRATNKNPCKNYATEAATEKATAAAATHIGNYFSRSGEGKQAYYVVFYVAAWGRWVGCINQSEVLSRPDSAGGYLGIEPGFFKF